MRTGTPIQIYLPDGMKELLVEVARRNMRKISAEVVIALRQHLEANGLPYADAPSSATGEPAPAESKPAGGKGAAKKGKKQG